MDRRNFTKLFAAAFSGLSTANLELAVNSVASIGTKAEVISGLVKAFTHIRRGLFFSNLAENTSRAFISNDRQGSNPRDYFVDGIPLTDRIQGYVNRSDSFFDKAAEDFAAIFARVPVSERENLFGFSEFYKAVAPNLDNSGLRFMSELVRTLNYNVKECPNDIGSAEHWKESRVSFKSLKNTSRYELNKNLEILEKKQEIFDTRQSHSAVFSDMAAARKALQYPAKTVLYHYRSKIPYESHKTDPQQNAAHRNTWELKLRYTDSTQGELIADKSTSCEGHHR